MTVQLSQEKVFYPLDLVLGDPSFFWVGRGGFAITHPGNMRVRSIVAKASPEYAGLARSKRGSVATKLLQNEFSRIKFVIKRETVLTAFKNESKGARRIGLRRMRDILKKHGSLTSIASYPNNVCLEVGEAWAQDIIGHLLREEHRQLHKRSHNEDVEVSKKRLRLTKEQSSVHTDRSDAFKIKKKESAMKTSPAHSAKYTVHQNFLLKAVDSEFMLYDLTERGIVQETTLSSLNFPDHKESNDTKRQEVIWSPSDIEELIQFAEILESTLL